MKYTNRPSKFFAIIEIVNHAFSMGDSNIVRFAVQRDRSL